MKRSASLLVVAMMVGVLGVTGCKGSDEQASEQDNGATVAASTESPATQSAATQSPVQGPAAAESFHGERDMGRLAGFFGRTAGRFHGAFERWEKRREMERLRMERAREIARERRAAERREHERREHRRFAQR
jgi:hypothetical protein